MSEQASTGAERERRVTQAFVALAGGLTQSGEPLALVEQLTGYCADLLDVASAGLLLADSRGLLSVVAASTANTRRLEAFQAQSAEGPCHDCYTTGAPVLIADLTVHHARWPHFVPAALQAGFVSVHAVPMRMHDHTLGALNLFSSSPGTLNDQDVSLAQALADVASVALVQDRNATSRDALNTQLQTALNSRVLIEQAKGLLAQSGDLDMANAFTLLRKYARDHNLKINDVAQALVSRGLSAATVLHQLQERVSDQPSP